MKRRLFHFARLAHRTEEEVLSVARALGVQARDASALVPPELVDRLDAALGIDRLAVPPPPSPATAGAQPAGTSPLPASEPSVVPAPVPRQTPPAPAVPKPRLPSWSTVGHPVAALQYLSATEVAQIHWILVDDFAKSRDPIDPPGVKSQPLLESAVGRLHTALGGDLKYPTLPMAAAALLHAIICNHAFHNGNKRTALVATLSFLDRNGYLLEADDDELFDYLMRIASHDIGVPAADSVADEEMLTIARWIHSHCRPISKLEKPLKFQELRTILLQYGCEFSKPKRGNRMNISRGGLATQVYYRNDGSDVERNTIHKIRQDLALTEADGYDSAIFYNSSKRVSEFIHRYRRTLDRLAKV